MKEIDKIKKLFNRYLNKAYKLRNRLIDRDDFNWSRYHKNYSNQIHRAEKIYTTRLSKKDYKIINGKLIINDLILPIPPSHEILYKIIFDLQPKSIFEVGCGGGDHLLNLNTILSHSNSIKFGGSDLLEKQIEFLYKRNPQLKKIAKIFVHDITLSPIPTKTSKKELVYTQTVIMHIQKKKRHMDALRNMFHSSNKYIVLMENWSRHNFYEDIKKISKEEHFPWKKLYIYKVDSGKQIALVLSKIPLKNKTLEYKEIKRNEELLKYLNND